MIILKLIKNFFKLKEKYINKNILLNGWIRNIRKKNKNTLFIDLNDGSSIKCIQIIYKFKNSHCIKIGSSIKILGIIKFFNNNIEIFAKKIFVLGTIKEPNKYLIFNKNSSIKNFREFTHLRSRTFFFSALSRIRNSLYFNIHKFMNKNQFIWIPSPIITPFDTEGKSEMFHINSKNKNFFNKKVFLSVSGQLHVESYACSMVKVYSFGPVFRAENSNTSKHLAEFWMLEPEISFYNLNKIINFSEYLIKKIILKVLTENENDISFINKKNNFNTINILYNFLNNKFIKIKYNEIIKILNNNKFIIKWGEDINKEKEEFLLKIFKKPIYITNFPKKIKPFYMKENKNKKTVLSMDLIFPTIGEIIGGSERENDYLKLKENMKILNIKNNFYLDLRKFSTVPHSGFGLGFERLLSLITGIKNLKDISPFPRYPNKIDF